MRKLTTLQQMFLDELTKDPTNGTAAMERVYQATGKTVARNVTKAVASETLQKPHVAAAWKKKLEAMAAKAGLKALDIINDLRAMADVDVADVVPWDEDGAHLIPSAKLPKPTRLMIKKIKIVETSWVEIGKDGEGVEKKRTTTELEMHDSIRIRELLGRYLGLWEGEGERHIHLHNHGRFQDMPNEELLKLVDGDAG